VTWSADADAAVLVIYYDHTINAGGFNDSIADDTTSYWMEQLTLLHRQVLGCESVDRVQVTVNVANAPLPYIDCGWRYFINSGPPTFAKLLINEYNAAVVISVRYCR
jgi:hypothetical protein